MKTEIRSIGMVIVRKPLLLRNWSDFTYLSDRDRMLNVRKKIVVMNVKILIDQVARYEVKEWVQRSKSKLRAQSARVLPSPSIFPVKRRPPLSPMKFFKNSWMIHVPSPGIGGCAYAVKSVCLTVRGAGPFGSKKDLGRAA